MRTLVARRFCLPLSSLAGLLTVVALPAVAADGSVIKAASRGDFAAVRNLIGAGTDVNEPSADGSTALLWAAYHGDADMAKALLAAGAEVDVANRYGITPLLQASRMGDAATIKVLLDAGAKVDLAHPDGETPLMAASRTGRIDAVNLLLEHGADPNASDTFQEETSLMRATAEGHVEVVDALLKAGANPNAQAHVTSLTERKNADHYTGGFTALMWAARNGNEELVRRLVAAGADLNMRNGDDATATMIAIVNDRFDMAEMLVELGAGVDDGSLFHAVEMRDATTDWYARDGSKLRWDHPNKNTALDLIAFLLDKGADPNKPFVGQMHSATMCCDTSANASPFFRAAVAADVEALKLLIAHGAEIEWTPSRVEGGGRGANGNVGRTPLMVALKGGKGVPLSAGPGYTREGPPPFREPSNREPAAALKVLLDAGANPNTTFDNATVLHQAVDTRNLESLRVLIAGGDRKSVV